jgi:hypothetical protein
MGRTGLFLAVTGIAAMGATVFLTARSIQQRQIASLEEKQRQTAEKIKTLVEAEVAAPAVGSAPAAPVANSGSFSSASTGVCSSLEFVGAGPDEVNVDPALWSQFMGEYHAAKADLIQWVAANRSRFPDQVIARMESEIRNTRVMRPQNQLEPDLTWRGISAWTRPRAGTMDANERPALIHVGSGFLELFRKDRPRARFEIARLLAQSWSPCELAGTRESAAWKDLMGCMGITEEQAKCSAGAVSEATWAVSSAVAALVSRPGCQVPAFADEKTAGCLRDFHRGDVASYAVEKAQGRSVATAGPAADAKEGQGR